MATSHCNKPVVGSRRPLSSSPQSSSFTSTSHHHDTLGFSTASLGLERQWIRPLQHEIRKLPEVDAAWQNFPSLEAIRDLDRASDVFASFAKGGQEHLAVLSLQAECQQRLAHYDKAIAMLKELAELTTAASGTTSSPPQHFREDLILARAKAHWFAGQFDESLELCESILSTYNDLEETFPTTNLHMAAAMTGKALSQLAAMETLDDAYSVRDFFRVAMNFLQRHPPQDNSLPIAAVHSNAGVAEAVYNIFLEDTNGVSMPINTALKTWFQGLQKTRLSSGAGQSIQLIAASKSLEASIQSNLAWGVLNYEDDRSDRLSKASEYAKKALAVYDVSSDDDDGAGNPNLLLVQKEGLPRVLSIVASCYKEAESAVTAEGLFQSATDRKSLLYPSTLTLLELKDAYMEYADLCQQWDRREADANRLSGLADEIGDSLPAGWKGRNGILGSLWFWTPSDFT